MATPPKRQPTTRDIERVHLMRRKNYGVRDIAMTIGITQRDVRRVLGITKHVQPTLRAAATRLIRQGYDRDIVRAVFGADAVREVKA